MLDKIRYMYKHKLHSLKSIESFLIVLVVTSYTEKIKRHENRV